MKRSILVALLLVACLFSGAHPTVWAKSATADVASATYTYDSPSIARVDVHEIEGADASPAQLIGAPEVSALPSVEAGGRSTTLLERNHATEAANAMSSELQSLSEAHLTDNGITVLGSYPEYITKAQDLGASYFDLGDAWNPESGPVANSHFIDVIAQRGD